MPFEIVGREEDRASVEAFVGQAVGGAAADTAEGVAGRDPDAVLDEVLRGPADLQGRHVGA